MVNRDAWKPVVAMSPAIGYGNAFINCRYLANLVYFLQTLLVSDNTNCLIKFFIIFTFVFLIPFF